MRNLLQNINGDKAIWAIAALLALFSFLPVYSASSNLVYVVGNGTTVGHLVKHALLLFLGFGIIYGVHKIPTHFFKGLSLIAMPIVIVLLIFVLAQGTTAGETNASRWIRLPLVGFGFQPSNLAAVVLMIYVARYLSKVRDVKVTFSESIVPLWLPVFLVVVLILPANFSTAGIIFSMVLMLCFLGGYPIKYLLGIVGTGIACLALFILVAKAAPDLFPNRVDTWMSRIDSFSNPEDTEANYQIEKAKIAIATGGVMGKGAGKSVQKNFLPQSSSDFIYAIIVEEYGLLGGFALMFFYLFLLFRIVVVANGCTTIFSKLLVLGVGLPIVFQALINMAVAVELFPVTGQNLPLISSGGTSSWMTCLAIGIILSASNKSMQQTTESTVDIDESNPLEVLSGQL
ncbi:MULTISPECIES: FtsW/RodA/SpoVE family cell cycle protein [Maribacter]|uniref:Probable peptidoglycan glycosyltransferase FtsW n=2 Tax=Maribacter TaxID=252356 RepID=A0A5R8LZ38_9FLAO|nr:MULTISPECIES: FtsW/RodA/SpoVE family cell cycle protein [Maribacter]MDC6406459.1 FtsW/RodA/SpoVE family cell cycle protein [Maribacter sp. PR66]MEE1973579.1 FtsW/RodA/SpoVE family cell cycle protein [Maribacter flavus]TLF42626.1 cell division protein FtsW [Maribacter aurantiacus]